MNRIVALALCLAVTLTGASAADPVEIGQNALGNIFTEGEPVAIPVRAQGERLQWRVLDFFGAEVASGSETLTGRTATLEPDIKGTGYFTIDVTAMAGGQALGQAQTSLAVVPPPGPPRADSPFGVMTHFAQGWPTDIIPLIAKAGLHRVRDEQPWRKIERARGQYDFPPRLAGYMSELAALHIEPLVVLAFANPLYDRGKTPFSAEGRAAYAAYAAAVARNYGPEVRAYEVWNEYNGSFCNGPCRGDRPGFYTLMLKEAYESLKAVDPSLTVLGGAGVPIPLDFFRGQFEDGALAAMDAIAIHPYRKRPEGVEEKIQALRDLMSQYGTPKPIWATEFSDISDMRNGEEAARYLVRMSTLLLSAKVERIYWYLLRDYKKFKGMGLVHGRNDPRGRYSPAPAYVAYSVLIHELDGTSFVRREPSAPGMRVYLFADGDREVRVGWSTAGAGTYESASEGPVKIVTIMGGETEAVPENGRMSVALGENPVYIVAPRAP
jgi:hypothetical protein